MNMLLIRGGYPPVAVRPADRKPYLDSLERASLADDLLPYQTFMHERLDFDLGGVSERLARGCFPTDATPPSD